MDLFRRAVLVVDDDEDWLALIAEVLSDEGYSVCTASDGRAAYVCSRRARPDVVVTDVQMPCMNGLELLEGLRAFDRSLPVIVVTAEDTREIGPTLKGVFRVIRKPATADVVVSAVREALMVHGRARLRRIAGGALAAARETARSLRPTRSPRTPAREGSGLKRRRGRMAFVAGCGVAAVAAIVVGMRGLLA